MTGATASVEATETSPCADSLSLADVIDTILDKGLVIDAQATVSVIGIPLVNVDARVVVASIDTYLRFAEAVDRLDLPDSQDAGLSDVIEGTRAVNPAETVGEVGGAVNEILGGGQDEETTERGGVTSGSDELSGRDTGILVYGVVPGDVEKTPGATGLGDPPAEVAVVGRGDIAAIVSEVPLDRPLGTPEDLRAYERLLSATAAVPVVPVRFGSVLPDVDAVRDMLDEYHDRLRDTLAELEGRVEYIVRGRYAHQAVLSEVLDESVEARRLRDRIRDQPEELTHRLRARLGEIVHRTVEAKRDKDTHRLVEVLEPLSDALTILPASHEEDAANVAVLVRTARRRKFEKAVDDLAEDWSQRINLRLLGPLAAFHFATPLDAGGLTWPIC